MRGGAGPSLSPPAGGGPVSSGEPPAGTAVVSTALVSVRFSSAIRNEGPNGDAVGAEQRRSYGGRRGRSRISSPAPGLEAPESDRTGSRELLRPDPDPAGRTPTLATDPARPGTCDDRHPAPGPAGPGPRRARPAGTTGRVGSQRAMGHVPVSGQLRPCFGSSCVPVSGPSRRPSRRRQPSRRATGVMIRGSGRRMSPHHSCRRPRCPRPRAGCPRGR